MELFGRRERLIPVFSKGYLDGRPWTGLSLKLRQTEALRWM